MPFCNRCGDICKSNERCKKCGGLAVNGQVKWPVDSKRSDSWTRTYVKSSPKPSSSRSTTTSTSATTPTTSTLNRRQSPTRLDEETKFKVFNSNNDNDHNNSKRGWDNNAIDNCPTSPLLETADGTLTKLVGSVLSPQTPITHPYCSSCECPFAPNATLYIHPQDDVSSEQARAYCYHCYVAHFSKGNCVVCNRAVIGEYKVEGKFIRTSAGVFHSKCFRCEGCDIDLSKDPLVDLEGYPSCPNCFDTSPQRSLERKRNPKFRNKNRESVSFDPAIKDLNNRLGLPPQADSTTPTRKREGRLSTQAVEPNLESLSIQSTPEKQGSLASLADIASKRSSEFDLSPRRMSARDIVTDRKFEGVSKYASPPPSPPKKSNSRKSSIESFPRPSHIRSRSQSITDFHEEISNNSNKRSSLDFTNDVCKVCKKSLKENLENYTIVRIPGEGSFHQSCLTCGVCKQPIKINDEKTSVIKMSNSTMGHVECVPSKEVIYSKPKRHSILEECVDNVDPQIGVRNVYKTPPKIVSKTPIHATLTPSPSTNFKTSSPVKSTVSTPSPRKSIWASRSTPFSPQTFGGMSMCPSCGDKLTMFEYTPGPAGTKYHKKCLKCRGCSKELDSGAKVDFDGYVWCRKCFDTFVPKPRPLTYQSTLTS